MLNLRPTGPGIIEGIVISTKAVPVRDAQVTVELDPARLTSVLPFPTWTATTNTRGEFCIRELPVKPTPEAFSIRYLVTARKDDDSAHRRTWLCDEVTLDFLLIVIPSSPDLDIDEFEEETDPEFEDILANLDYTGAAVSGRVFDAETEEPIEGITIQSSRSSPGPDRIMRATTDANGFYSFERVPPGHRIFLRLNKPGYLIGRGREVKHLQLEPGQVLNNVDYHVKKGVDLRGRVVDESGVPAAGVRVFNRCQTDDEQAQSVITDERGTFVLRGYKPGSIVSLFLVDSPYWAPPMKAINLGEHGVDGLKIVANPAAMVVGVIVDEYGLPAADRSVRIRSKSEKDICDTTTTWESGEYYFRGLPPGTYKLGVGAKERTLQLAGGELASGIVIEDPSRRNRGIAVVRDCFLSGRLLNRLGTPVAGARVLAFTRPKKGDAESWGETTSDGNGHFRIEALGVGDHQITVCADGYAVATGKGLPTNTAEVEIVLDRLITVSGSVVDDSTGEPIQDFSIARTSRLLWNLEDQRLEFTTIYDLYGRFSTWSYPGGTAVIARARGYEAGYVWLPDVEEGREVDGVEIRLSRSS